MKHLQKGYILVFSFSILALCTALISLCIIKGITHKKFCQATIEREQLDNFALSGIALAQSFLSFASDNQTTSEQKNQTPTTSGQIEKENEDIFEKKLIERVLPVVNKPKLFMLKNIIADFPVQLKLTIFSEDGKINLNGLYDFIEKKFYDQGIEGKDKKAYISWIFEKIAALEEKPSLLEPFIKHLEQRKGPFNDVTELLQIPEFAQQFQDTVFYTTQNLDKNKKNRLFLTDIFTVTCKHDRMQPWLLSESIQALAGIKSEKNRLDKKDKKIDLTKFSLQADWKNDWKMTLQPIYDLSYDQIPDQLRTMLSSSFSADFFSINIEVINPLIDTHNEPTQLHKIFAILEQKKLADGSIMYDVIKIYQL